LGVSRGGKTPQPKRLLKGAKVGLVGLVGLVGEAHLSPP